MSAHPAAPRPMSQRPVPFAARRDLTVQRVQHGAQWYWVLKDPLRNELFRLRADQYALHQLLDGRRSLDELRSQLVAQFRDLSVTAAQLQELVADLFRKGLVWSTRPGQAAALARRQRAGRRRRVLAAAANPLFVRFPGWDPQRALDRLYPAVRWMFRPDALLAAAAFTAATWIFLLLRIDDVWRRAPATAHLATGASLVALWAAVAVAKTLHELGHALTCRHFGGECHEIGVALMMFSPSMYCDVSDAGRLPERRARLAIGAAGMFVELFVAALAFVVWWNTWPGVLHDFCWAIFIAGNLSVVAFNLNPLLRLDGYYLLSDWLGVPNLRQKADRLFGCWLGRVTLGLSIPPDPLLPSTGRGLLGMYAAASAAYRLHLTVFISFLLARALAPYGLRSMGLTLGAVAVAASLTSGVRSAVRAWRAHRHRTPGSLRPRVTLAAAAVLLAATLLAPFPVLVSAPMVLELKDARNVYVTTPGRLAAIRVRPGQRVRAKDALAELTNPDLLAELTDLDTACAAQQVALAVHQSTGDAGRAAAAQAMSDSLAAEVADRRDRVAALTVLAPCDGVVIPAPPTAESRRLRVLASGPLEPGNLGAYLTAGTHLLTVAPSNVAQGVLLIPQAAAADFQPGARVRVKLDHAPGGIVHASVVACSTVSAEYAQEHDALAAEKSAVARAESSDAAPRLVQAEVRFDDATGPVVAGMRGEVRRIAWRRSLASWLWRQARSTFNLL